MSTPVLLAALVSAAFAASKPPVGACVLKTEKGYEEPPTLSRLLACQRDAIAKIDALNNAVLEFQHEEVRDYLRRHPERATTAEEDEDEAPEEAGAGKAGGKTPGAVFSGSGSSRKRSGRGGSAPKNEHERRSARALESNMETLAVPEDLRESFRDLRKAMWQDSPNGQFGVTPEMASRIMLFLIKNQGGVSAEMSNLLRSASKDGVNLSHDTMRQLKKAARQGSRHGLDLGVEPKLERWLLDPSTDPTGKEGGAPAHPGGAPDATQVN